jgi:cell filamentation protein
MQKWQVKHPMCSEGEYAYHYHLDSDTYCYTGSRVLINNFNIRDQETLTIAERQITALKIAELERKPIKGNFDLHHIQKIHKFIFSDIYQWAGSIRGGDFLIKNESIFCRAMHIENYAAEIHAKLKQNHFLAGLNKSDFIIKLAYYMGEINALHPFREGNGRTARLFFKQLCNNANYDLELHKTSKESLLHADIQAFNRKYEPLIHVLNEVVSNK